MKPPSSGTFGSIWPEGIFRPEPDASVRNRQLGTFAAWAAVTGIGLMLTPDRHLHGTHQQLGLPPCPCVLLFDRPCPGCGLTTSWTALLHGQIGTAFHAHPLGPFLYAIFTATAWLSLIAWQRQRVFDTDSAAINRFVMAVLVILMTFGIARFAATPHYGTGVERFMTDVSQAMIHPKD